MAVARGATVGCAGQRLRVPPGAVRWGRRHPEPAHRRSRRSSRQGAPIQGLHVPAFPLDRDHSAARLPGSSGVRFPRLMSVYEFRVAPNGDYTYRPRKTLALPPWPTLTAAEIPRRHRRSPSDAVSRIADSAPSATVLVCACRSSALTLPMLPLSQSIPVLRRPALENARSRPAPPRYATAGYTSPFGRCATTTLS